MNKKKLNKILKEHQKHLDTFGKKGKKADLSGVDLRGADLKHANLSFANLSGADLRGANLICADLRDANLSGADLSDADLSDADLRDVDLNWIRGKTILQFKVKRDNAIFVDGFIRIGCQYHSVKEWLKDYKKIGKKHNYSKEEISNYGLFIKMCAKLKVEQEN